MFAKVQRYHWTSERSRPTSEYAPCSWTLVRQLQSSWALRFKSGWVYFTNWQRTLRMWRNRRDKSRFHTLPTMANNFHVLPPLWQLAVNVRTEFTTKKNTVDHAVGGVLVCVRHRLQLKRSSYES
jgi:hypothetical protein